MRKVTKNINTNKISFTTILHNFTQPNSVPLTTNLMLTKKNRIILTLFQYYPFTLIFFSAFIDKSIAP